MSHVMLLRLCVHPVTEFSYCVDYYHASNFRCKTSRDVTPNGIILDLETRLIVAFVVQRSFLCGGCSLFLFPVPDLVKDIVGAVYLAKRCQLTRSKHACKMLMNSKASLVYTAWNVYISNNKIHVPCRVTSLAFFTAHYIFIAG